MAVRRASRPAEKVRGDNRLRAEGEKRSICKEGGEKTFLEGNKTLSAVAQLGYA